MSGQKKAALNYKPTIYCCAIKNCKIRCNFQPGKKNAEV